MMHADTSRFPIILLRYISISISFISSRIAATGVLWLNCRVVFLRFGAKMTDLSGKIDVRRLIVGDLLIQILLHYALLGLVFLVPGLA